MKTFSFFPKIQEHHGLYVVVVFMLVDISEHRILLKTKVMQLLLVRPV